MDTVVALGLFLGLFGGFLSGIQALRAFIADYIQLWFENADDCINQLKECDDDVQKKGPEAHRKRMDTWIWVWKSCFGLPVCLFLGFMIFASFFCVNKWDNLNDETASFHYYYNDFVLIYTIVILTALIVALLSLAVIWQSAKWVESHTVTALGERFTKPNGKGTATKA